MGAMLALVGNLLVLGGFVVAILMAVKMFKAQQIWQGIVSILCTLFAIVYGFSKKDELGLGNLPLLCLALTVGGIVLQIVGVVLVGGEASASFQTTP